MSDKINCPKCEHEHEADGAHEDLVGERTCDECGFAFIVEIEYDPVYYTKCVKCEAGDVSDEEALLGYGGTTRCKHCLEVMDDGRWTRLNEMAKWQFCIHRDTALAGRRGTEILLNPSA